MANYAQVLKSTAQGRRQWWYISGSVPALVQDAYELALSHVYSVNVGVEKTVFLGPEASLFDIEHELVRDYEGERMVVVLHEAEKFGEWDELASLLRRTGSDRFFIAVSNAAPPNTKDTWARVFVGNQKARFVVCNPMTPEDKSVWVNSRLTIDRDAESFLITRAHGDYNWLLNQIRKLEYLDADRITLKLVQAICPSQGDPDFINSLLHRRQIAALAAISRGLVSPSTIGELVHTMHNIITISEEKKHVGVSMRLLIERTGMTAKEISVFEKADVHYDPRGSMRVYTALTKLYKGLREGNRNAYIALVTRW